MFAEKLSLSSKFSFNLRKAYDLLFALNSKSCRTILGMVYKAFVTPYLLALVSFGAFLLKLILKLYLSVFIS